MQMRNREADAFVGTESFHELIDFPTVEELLTALDDSLAHVPWLGRSVAVDVTARSLAQHWRELMEPPGESPPTKPNDHPLDSWEADPWSSPDLSAEPDFMIDFATFLMGRLTKRVREVRQAQHLLRDELAKLRI